MLRGLLSFGSMTMVSRVLGLLRDISINHVFGASMATDAFWVAFRIPSFMPAVRGGFVFHRFRAGVHRGEHRPRLRQARVYRWQPGWGRHHLARLVLACAAMTIVLLLGRWCWPDWTLMPVLGRVWRLALVGAGGATYVAVLFAAGFRVRELHGD